MEKLEWQAPEYEPKERNADWFWALGIIIVAGSLASLIYGNYFFAVLVILSGLLLGFFSIKKPQIIHYELNDQGLKIGDQLYLYENIKSFFVRAGEKPILFIKSERMFMPIISMPIDQNQIEEIHAQMLDKEIPEEEMKEQISEKIMEKLGF